MNSTTGSRPLTWLALLAVLYLFPKIAAATTIAAQPVLKALQRAGVDPVLDGDGPRVAAVVGTNVLVDIADGGACVLRVRPVSAEVLECFVPPAEAQEKRRQMFLRQYEAYLTAIEEAAAQRQDTALSPAWALQHLLGEGCEQRLCDTLLVDEHQLAALPRREEGLAYFGDVAVLDEGRRLVVGIDVSHALVFMAGQRPRLVFSHLLNEETRGLAVYSVLSAPELVEVTLGDGDRIAMRRLLERVAAVVARGAPDDLEILYPTPPPLVSETVKDKKRKPRKGKDEVLVGVAR